MPMPIRASGWLSAVLCLVIAASMGDARCQEYPVKPVRVLVSGPPAGGADVLLRPIALKLGESLGQQFVVDNRPGAGGLTSVLALRSAAADGYTLLFVALGGAVIRPYLDKKPPFDPIVDLTPITLVARSPLIIAVHPSLPVRTTKELIELAKARPGQVLYASNGPGSFSHLTTELFARAAGVNMVHVPYKGGTPAVVETIGGHTQLVITAMPTLMAAIKGNRLRALAVTGSKRSAAMPDLPTAAESGLPRFESTQWYALFAPRYAPNALMLKVSHAVAFATEHPSVKSALSIEGAELDVSGPQALGALVSADAAKWRRLIADVKIALD